MIKGRIHTTGGSCVPEMQRYLKSSSSNTTCEYYLPLCTFALNLTGSHESARDAVQEVFYRIWKNRGDIQIDHSIRAWLYKAVRNQALNMIEQQRSRLRLAERWKEEMNSEAGVHGAGRQGTERGELLFDEGSERENLVRRIWEMVGKMPPQRKMVFELHRRHGLSYEEIARVMQISRKTVENHMGRALEELRNGLHAGREEKADQQVGSPDADVLVDWKRRRE